jgi:hypothetical protein
MTPRISAAHSFCKSAWQSRTAKRMKSPAWARKLKPAPTLTAHHVPWWDSCHLACLAHVLPCCNLLRRPSAPVRIRPLPR